MALGKKLVSSSLLLVSVKVLQRLLGLISIVILARLLSPEDFGIVAIAAIMLQFSAILSNSGIQEYIPQKDQVDDEDLNTAWTIDVSMKFILWLLLFLSAPLIGRFYDEAELVAVIQVVSVVVFLRALQNPGIHLLRRQLVYKPIFWLLAWQKALSFIFVISIALITKSYWAMIIGDIVSALVGIIGSYLLHPYRPRLSLKKMFEQWAFTKWTFAKGIVGVLGAQVDTLMVSKWFSIGELGGYSVIRGISVLPATDIVGPAVEPLIATFARVKYDLAALDHQLRTSLLVIFLLILPACMVLIVNSDAIVLALLGEQWKDKGPLLANFTVLLFVFSLGNVLGNLFIAVGKVKFLFFYDLFSLVFIFFILLAFVSDDLADFALLRGVLGLVTVLPWLILTLHYTNSHVFSFMMTLFMPVALITFLATLLADYFALQTDFIYISLAWNFAVFGVFYLLLIVVFYAALLHRIKEWRHLKRLLVSTIFPAKSETTG